MIEEGGWHEGYCIGGMLGSIVVGVADSPLSPLESDDAMVQVMLPMNP